MGRLSDEYATDPAATMFEGFGPATFLPQGVAQLFTFVGVMAGFFFLWLLVKHIGKTQEAKAIEEAHNKRLSTSMDLWADATPSPPPAQPAQSLQVEAYERVEAAADTAVRIERVEPARDAVSPRLEVLPPPWAKPATWSPRSVPTAAADEPTTHEVKATVQLRPHRGSASPRPPRHPRQRLVWNCFLLIRRPEVLPGCRIANCGRQT